MRSKTILLLITICLLLVSSKLEAQQVMSYKSFFENPYLVNPSFAGERGGTNAVLLHQNSLVQFTGSPKSTLLMIDTELKNKKMGLGLFISNDDIGILNKTSAKLTYAYKIMLNSESHIRFGASAGVFYQKINFDELNAQDKTESSLLSTVDNKSSVDADFGVSYINKALTAGISVNNLFRTTTNYADVDGNESISFKTLRSYFLFGQYDFNINEKFIIRPVLSFETADGLPALSKIGSQFVFMKSYMVGVNYTHKTAFGINVGVIIQENLRLNYAYENTIHQASYSFSTHEIMLSYAFTKNTKSAGSTYSNGGYSNNSEEVDYLKDDIEKLKDKVSSQEEELAMLRKEKAKESTELNKIIESSNKYNSEEVVDTTSSDRTYYVVVGAFKQVDNIKRLQKILKRELELKTSILKNNSFYFSYSTKYSDYKSAHGELERMRAKYSESKYIVGNIWIYSE